MCGPGAGITHVVLAGLRVVMGKIKPVLHHFSILHSA